MSGFADVADAAGPEQIRAGFTAALTTNREHTGHIDALTRVLTEAADWYEQLQMAGTTVAHLRDAATALTASLGLLSAAGERLQAAAADFAARDGRVADAVAEAGNLMDAAGYRETLTPIATSGTLTSTEGDSSMATSPTPGVTGADAGPETASPRNDRDRLARGYYLEGWENYGPGRAREWDAGRADPQQVTDAYAVADKILADRAAIAAGPGAGRLQAMRDHGVAQCPTWCPQSDDEDQHEQHVGPGTSFTTENGDTLTVRPRVSWWPDTAPGVEIALTSTGNGAVALTATELSQLQQVSDNMLAEAQRSDTTAGKPAYPGAALDAADAAWVVSTPAAAAHALDLRAHANGYYFTEAGETKDDESTDGPYLDWSTRVRGIRRLEAGDGVDAATLLLTGTELRELRDGIGRLVGAVNDGKPDPGALHPRGDDESECAYIDWRVVEDGVRSVEFGDGDATVVHDMTENRLQQWYERLALQVQLDEHDDLT